MPSFEEIHRILEKVSEGKCGVNHWFVAWEEFSKNRDTSQMIDLLAWYAQGLINKGEFNKSKQVVGFIGLVNEKGLREKPEIA